MWGINEDAFTLRQKTAWENFEKLKFSLDAWQAESLFISEKEQVRLLGEVYFSYIRDIRHQLTL